MNCGVQKIIDSFPLNVNITVGTAIPETTYIGYAGIAQLNVSFLVRCAQSFYGKDCLTKCLHFQGCFGCGLSGYTGEYCQFSTLNCGEISCNGNGQCIDGSPTCDCNPGFIGDFCQFDINACEGVSCNNSGECVNQIDGFMCDCNPGFTGDLCQYTDDCLGVSCNNSGECINQIDGFVCECNVGFTGTLCQYNLSSCENGDGNCNGKLRELIFQIR